jgi:hypothetical protein
MYVYFIRSCGGTSMIKIGKATDPERRLAELQTGSPFKLKLLAKFICRSEKHALHVESILHNYCKRWRIRGEWFEYGRTKGLLAMLQRRELSALDSLTYRA